MAQPPPYPPPAAVGVRHKRPDAPRQSTPTPVTYQCVDDTDTVDDFCKATILHEKSLYAPSAVFDDLDDYWCTDKVLDKITDGSYCGWAKGNDEHQCV